MYIQAALKIFGVWTAELAQSWNDEELLDLKVKVKSTIERMQVLANSEHIEVQERVRRFSSTTLRMAETSFKGV